MKKHIDDDWYLDGNWYVLETKTNKPFERVKVDATRAITQQGLASLFTTHEWKGKICHIHSWGAEGTVEFDHGRIASRVRIHSIPATLLKDKILSDIRAATLDVSGAIDSGNREVFIVHGHNDMKRMELKTFLTKLDLRPIVLDEEDDMGMTIIEKFEYYASCCGFTFVLMTPDDKIADTDETESKWRARQNVIMELGWFMARLGRERVVILYEDELEIPSDIYGVVYLKFEKSIYEISEKIRQRLKGVGLIS